MERARAALLAAHAAGDTDSAQKLADYIRADQAIEKVPSESSSMSSGRKAGGITGGVLSALQGPAFDFVDEAAGVGSGALSAIKGEGYDSGYQSGRDYVRGAVKQHEEDYPIGSQVAKVVT